MQLSCVGIDLAKFVLIAGLVEPDSQIGIVSKLDLHLGGIGGGQQPRPDILGADCIGLRFLVSFAQVVTDDGHGEGKSDDEAEQGQSCRLHHPEILPLLVS